MEKCRGTGGAFPSTFEPPPWTTLPDELFSTAPVGADQHVRFVCRKDPTKALVFTDGACPNNGQLGPRAGWAVVCGPPHDNGTINGASGRLEDRGPFGDVSGATSNRAELRAVIGALRLCDWKAAGFDSIVIATDSSYVVDGATSWAKSWVRNGWRKSSTGDPVKNRDLWELLLGEVERWRDLGLHVALWHIPRELNGDADDAAKDAAGPRSAAVSEFRDIKILSSQAKADTRVLFLCFDCEDLVDNMCSGLITRITSKAKMERATTPEAAMAKLEQHHRIIFIADAALTRHRQVWERVMDHLRDGSTVVLAGVFSTMVSGGQFNRFFARLGLPWERGSYYRSTVRLRRSAVDEQLKNQLPPSYSQKALFVKNVEPSAVWYAESNTSSEAAVVFTQVGRGNLGHMGDVNGEAESEAVILAMCGLLD